MAQGDAVNDERIFSDRDDEGEDAGYGGGLPYDEDEDEDGGWTINKDQSDSLWDSTEETTDEEEEPGELVDAGEEEEESPAHSGNRKGPSPEWEAQPREKKSEAHNATDVPATQSV